MCIAQAILTHTPELVLWTTTEVLLNEYGLHMRGESGCATYPEDSSSPIASQAQIFYNKEKDEQTGITWKKAVEHRI